MRPSVGLHGRSRAGRREAGAAASKGAVDGRAQLWGRCAAGLHMHWWVQLLPCVLLLLKLLLLLLFELLLLLLLMLVQVSAGQIRWLMPVRWHVGHSVQCQLLRLMAVLVRQHGIWWEAPGAYGSCCPTAVYLLHRR